MMAERRRGEARAVPEGEQRGQGEEPIGRAETAGGVVSMMRGGFGMTPAWFGRISWGSILAGVLVAIASQLILSSIGVLIGFGTTSATSVAGLRGVASDVGVWTAISALIASFIGGYVASVLAAVRFSSDGLWHGLTVWALALVGGIYLSSIGISGLLGFAGNAASILRGFVPSGVNVSPDAVKAAADIASRSALYFLIGSLLSLGTALLGGWLGSHRENRSEAIKRETGRERMAA
jgi:hypothetical protein